MTSEKYILRWIWPFVRNNLDRDQFGGIAQNSVAHYLIEVTNFILYNLDLNIPVPSLMTMVDFSKGFNRIHHGALIEELYWMNVLIEVLRIIISYLSDRKLLIKYKGGLSDATSLPGGLGQGTLLGMWMFLFRMNGYCKNDQGDRNIADIITRNGLRRPMDCAK